MKRNTLYSFILLIFFCAGISCNTIYQGQSLQYKSYRINNEQQKDSAVLNFLQPYSATVNSTMNSVIGIADISLEKKERESTLGNFIADAFFVMAKENYKMNLDIAVVNHGGIRLTQLPAGNVTTGKIFELMPFDNLLIYQKLKGDVLQKLLNLTAEKGGWPVAGMTMQIKDKKAVNVMIGGKPLDLNATYTVVNSDFVANGGDNADMLRNIPQVANGYLMRDAIIDYIKKLKSEGKNISARIENRVTNAE